MNVVTIITKYEFNINVNIVTSHMFVKQVNKVNELVTI